MLSYFIELQLCPFYLNKATQNNNDWGTTFLLEFGNFSLSYNSNYEKTLLLLFVLTSIVYCTVFK